VNENLTLTMKKTMGDHLQELMTLAKVKK